MGDPEDDQEIVEMINSRSGADLIRTGRAADGTLGGAIFVESQSGEPAVVTRYQGPLEAARRTASVLAHVRTHGLPVALCRHVIGAGDDVFVVQERLPGSPPNKQSAGLIDAIVRLNDRLQHALADRPDVPRVPLCLTESGEPYPRHEVLAQHGDRSRRVLAAIRHIGTMYPGEVAGDDLVHVDLTPSNVLVDDAGLITGLVDWNLGAYRGDRHLALVKTRFELEWDLRPPAVDPGAAEAAQRLDVLLAQRVSEPDLMRYWAHRMLYQLHWCLQFEPSEVVNWHLDVAEERLL